MIYTRVEYAMLLALVFALYMILRAPGSRLHLLMISSLVFYAWAGVFDTAIFMVVIGIAYLTVFLSGRFPRYQGLLLCTGIGAMAVHLLGWKYLPWAARGAGGELNLPLPLGISFFTLQGIGYLIDVWRGQIPRMSLKEFTLFKSFFPQLIAGPIVRGSDMWTFLKTMPTARRADVIEGLWLIGLGMVKKMIIADHLAIFVDGIFSSPGQLDRATLMLGAVAFYVQIWGDFSGYTDMGRGSALLFGLRLPENFLSTLYARGATDWSRRWHATLQTWVRDYLYFPMTAALKRLPVPMLAPQSWSAVSAVIGRYVSAMMVALWHGAAMNFFIWGLMLWFLATMEAIFVWAGLAVKNPTVARKVVQTLLMLPVFFLTGVFFRSPSLEVLGDYLGGLFLPNSNSVSFVGHAGSAYWRIALAFAIDGIMYYSLRNKRYVILEAVHARVRPLYERFPMAGDALLGIGAAGLIVCAIMFRSNNSLSGFIYFRF